MYIFVDKDKMKIFMCGELRLAQCILINGIWACGFNLFNFGNFCFTKCARTKCCVQQQQKYTINYIYLYNCISWNYYRYNCMVRKDSAGQQRRVSNEARMNKPKSIKLVIIIYRMYLLHATPLRQQFRAISAASTRFNRCRRDACPLWSPHRVHYMRTCTQHTKIQLFYENKFIVLMRLNSKL